MWSFLVDLHKVSLGKDSSLEKVTGQRIQTRQVITDDSGAVTRDVAVAELWWSCRFVVRDFAYDEQELLKEQKDHLRLLDEKKQMFVSNLL